MGVTPTEVREDDNPSVALDAAVLDTPVGADHLVYDNSAPVAGNCPEAENCPEV